MVRPDFAEASTGRRAFTAELDEASGRTGETSGRTGLVIYAAIRPKNAYLLNIFSTMSRFV